MRVLITGAGRAIGRATCEELTARGHEVVATARRPEVLADLDVADRLALDVTDPDSVAACFAAAGDLDAIVNNAAISESGPMETYPVDRFNAVLDTNVAGILRCVQAVAPAWRERGSGVIVNISSIQGRVGTPLGGAYTASKFAVEGLSETLHFELGHFGVRVCIVEPGYVAPGMKHGNDHDVPEAYAELHAQWNGADDKLTGGTDGDGRTPVDVAARIIADAVDNPDTPLRVPLGDDANLVLGVRKQMDDAEFEATMRAQLDLTW